MSQRHLYGDGTTYVERNPPVEWKDNGVDFTINDNATESEIELKELTFVGEIAEYIENEWIPTYGVFNGVPYRFEITQKGNTEVVFDGFIDLSEREILSESGPIMFRAPVIDLRSNVSVFDRISTFTQQLLLNQGYLQISDFVDVPVIKESKKNIAERALILGQLGYQIVTSFIRIIQDFLSAISDALGLSIAIGLIEILLLFLNTVIQINLLSDQILQHKDLLFPKITYYKGVPMKKVITAAFDKIGYPVEFGIIDPILSKIVLLASQSGFDGYPSQGVPASGILAKKDWGYLVEELMTTIKEVFNTRETVRGGIAQIRNRKDPFWDTNPLFNPVDTKLETTAQYQNGTKKEDTRRVDAVVYISYAIDPSDTHTLTENNDDSYEIHRQLITELDPRMNTLKGIKEVDIQYAMAVRKTAFDNLFDLFTGISGEFDLWLQAFQDQINNFASSIDPSAGADTAVSTILNMTPLGLLFENRNGVLKIDDNAFGIPKILYLEDYSVGKRLPSNFKDFIGAKAIYQNWYLPDSPADVNNFLGQYVLRNGWEIPFSLANYNQVNLNPSFEINSISGKFISGKWNEDDESAVTNAEQQEIFDRNITEEEI